MFVYFLITSWLVTILVCAAIKSVVSNYQEHQITLGGLITDPLSNARATPSPASAHYAASAITQRELLSLQKTPTFQLWAEKKSKTITRDRLRRAQTAFVWKLIALVAFAVAFGWCPFSAPLSATSNAPTLWSAARGADDAHRRAWVPVGGDADAIGVSPSVIGPYQCVASLAAAALIVAAISIVARQWRTVAALSANASSLVSFMATTNHDVRQLEEALNKVAAGNDDYTLGCSCGRRGMGALLGLALLLLRMGPSAVSAFAASSDADALDAPDYTLIGGQLFAKTIFVGTDDLVRGDSLGFVICALAAAVLVCA